MKFFFVATLCLISVASAQRTIRWSQALNKRCTGGSLVGRNSTLGACQTLCVQTKCTAINVPPPGQEGDCVVRQNCVQIDDTSSQVFTFEQIYVNPSDFNPQQPDSRMQSMPGSTFVEQRGKRCSDGTKVGETGNNIGDCFSTCRKNPDGCTAINLFSDGRCVVRIRCTIGDDDSTTVYVFRRIVAPPAPQPTDAPAPTRQAPAPTAAPFERVKIEPPGSGPFPLGVTMVRVEGTRCTGGQRIGGGNSIESCSSDCLRARNCKGFNYDGTNCIIRDTDCTTRQEVGAVFYEKRRVVPPVGPPAPQTRAPATQAPAPADSGSQNNNPAPAPRPPPGTAPSGPDMRVPLGVTMVREENTRCRQGNMVGEGNSIEFCSRICLRDSRCAGFNWNGNTCILRDSGCTKSDEEGSTYYEKRRVVPPPGAPAPSASQGSSNNITFNKRAYTRCIGGSLTGFADLDVCLTECNKLSECIGVNYNSDNSMCSLRNSDCRTEDAAVNFSFFVKVK